MNLGITSDSFVTTMTGSAVDAVRSHGYETALCTGDYGHGLAKIFIVATCRSADDATRFKRRIRLDHKRLTLYVDVFLDYHLMVQGPDERRIDHLVRKLYNEIPPIVEKYKLKNFDTQRFVTDFRAFLAGTGLTSGPLE